MVTILRTALAVLAISVAGCATQPPTPKEEAAVWLSEASRSIKVTVDPGIPPPHVQTRDYQMGKRVGSGLGHGAVGALYTIGTFCGGGPLGCVAGVIFAPIGFVAGAVVGVARVDSKDEHHSIEAAEGGRTMLDLAAQGIDLPALVARAALDEQRRAGGHKLVRDEGEAELRISFQTLHLFGAVGNDPPVGVVLSARGDLLTPAAAVPGWSTYTYEGPMRHVSQWQADGGKLLRAEIAHAAQQLGAAFADELSAQPSLAAASKVAAARAKRAAPPSEPPPQPALPEAAPSPPVVR